MRVRGAHSARTTHTGKPRCGSTIATAAATAAAVHLFCRAKTAARQIAAIAIGIISPYSIDGYTRHSHNATKTVKVGNPLKRTSAIIATAMAATRMTFHTALAAEKESCDSGANRAKS